jgi:uncharacterized protein (DUF1800 family)
MSRHHYVGLLHSLPLIPISLMLSAALAGCGGGGSGGGNPSGQSIAVTLNGSPQVRIGSTTQFAAAVSNSSNQAVTWQVNGVTGGSASTGTITATGLYTPPAAIPSPNTVTITAVSQASSSATASLTESILNPQPAVNSAAAVGLSPAYTVTINGSGFMNGSTVTIDGVKATVTSVSSSQITATASFTLAPTVNTAPLVVTNPDPGGVSSPSFNAQVTTQATLAAAARLLDQATFGPTLSDIQHVQSVGLLGYINEQFADSPTTLALIASTPPTPCANSLLPCLQSEWWQATLTAPDQLRQRVAFALAEQFVVSTNTVNSRAVVAFQNTLANDAFTNFYTIMNDVTLSPAMGVYLNMINSYKPTTVNGVAQIANENYARELMQLFSIGLVELNADGTPQTDSSNNTTPTYTQTQVQAFARAYTGWTFADQTGGKASKFPNSPVNYTMPMAAVESAHDMDSKILLSGTTLPAGQTAEQDLAGALQNLFNQPNVGPFVCRQLIQHLVSSNPSPAYVSRVSAVFANNGSNVRGDMKAVITAILLDPEARAGDTDVNAAGGHLREPVLWLTDVMRALNFTNNDVVAGNDVVANASYNTLGNYTSTLNEKPYASASVFNFFPPNYYIPGSSVNAPEFSLENTASAKCHRPSLTCEHGCLQQDQWLHRRSLRNEHAGQAGLQPRQSRRHPGANVYARADAIGHAHRYRQPGHFAYRSIAARSRGSLPCHHFIAVQDRALRRTRHGRQSPQLHSMRLTRSRRKRSRSPPFWSS